MNPSSQNNSTILASRTLSTGQTLSICFDASSANAWAWVQVTGEEGRAGILKLNQPKGEYTHYCKFASGKSYGITADEHKLVAEAQTNHPVSLEISRQYERQANAAENMARHNAEIVRQMSQSGEGYKL